MEGHQIGLDLRGGYNLPVHGSAVKKKGLLQLLSFCDSRDGSLKQSAVNIITVIIPSHLLDNPRILDDLLLSPSESHCQGTIYLTLLNARFLVYFGPSN